MCRSGEKNLPGKVIWKRFSSISHYFSSFETIHYFGIWNVIKTWQNFCPQHFFILANFSHSAVMLIKFSILLEQFPLVMNTSQKCNHFIGSSFEIEIYFFFNIFKVSCLLRSNGWNVISVKWSVSSQRNYRQLHLV